MTFHRIPQELRSLAQWCVWRYETPFGSKPTKVPYNPRNGFHAASDSRATWATFEEVCAAVANPDLKYDGIGFFFSSDDPYCGIDLDDPNGDVETFARQQKIYGYLNSYSELSPSGNGVHIIVKAKVPRGRKRSLVEIYSQGRFFTMTGNVHNEAAIYDRNTEVNEIWNEMGAGAEPSHFVGDFVEKNDDATVYKMASEAKNGDLFLKLWNGDWSGYPSNADASGSSEADFALIDIIAYYTENRPQIQRLFLMSVLGQRPKYARANSRRLGTLIGYMINKSFDRKLPDVDLSKLMDRVEAARIVPSAVAQAADLTVSTVVLPGPGPVAEPKAPAPTSNPFMYDGFDLTLWQREYPRGILGMVAKYVYDQAPRQVYEIALAAGLGFMAGLCGRAYNVNGTGLNHYIMMLAATGAGKEAMAQGIDKLVDAIKKRQPHAQSILGPADIASGQGLLKHLADVSTPCFLSITGEIGLRLQRMSAPNASSSETTLKSVFLDLYNKSGVGRSVKPTVYSDKKNNTPDINSPAFSLLGESVPGEFYKAFDETSVSGGLLPRFLIIEYDGPRPPNNKNSASHEIPVELVDLIDRTLLGISMRMQTGEVYTVSYTDEATELLDKIDKYSDAKINQVEADVLKQLWNRVYQKVLKLGAILAVSDNPHVPVMSLYHVKWAMSLIMTDVLRLAAKFNAGEMGQNNEVTEQEEVIRKSIKRYLTTDAHNLTAYRVRPDMHFDRIIPYQYIQATCVAMACFRNSKTGATNAMKASIQSLIDKGYLQDASTAAIRTKYEVTSAKLYAPSDPSWFLS